MFAELHTCFRSAAIWTTVPLCVALALPSEVAGQVPEGVIARCGASKGTGYFFWDEFANPQGPEWAEDGISSGRIILVRLGEEWDIQFDDTLGALGYRQDGATVMVLGANGGKLTVGAFRGTYTDTYTFSFESREVIWTSHKTGTLVPKVAIYRAECDFMASFTMP